jgi:diguanylate cyclase (GGDEF)-like protein
VRNRSIPLFAALYILFAGLITGYFYWMKDAGGNFTVLSLCILMLISRRQQGGTGQFLVLGINAAASVLLAYPSGMISPQIMCVSLAMNGACFVFSEPFQGYYEKLIGRENELKNRDLQLSDIKEQKLATALREDDDMEKEIKDIRSLYDAAKELSSSLNTNECMEKVNDILKKIIKSNFRISLDDINFMILFKKESDYHIAQSFGFDEESIKENEKVFVNSILKNVAKSQDIIYIPDTSRQSAEVSMAFNKSVMYIPFYVEKKLLGVICISGKNPNIFEPKQVESMKVLSNQIALSLEKTHLYEEVEKLSETDSLTGLYVHRYFQDKLENEIKRTARYGGTLALVLGDIDHFKNINDTYGHLAGDYILKTISIIMKNHTSQVDTVARYGGEEFTIIFPENDKEKAHAKAVKIRKEIEKYPFKYKDILIKVTMSMGVSSYPGDAIARRSLIDKADKALYKAKEEGRNRVIRAT